MDEVRQLIKDLHGKDYGQSVAAAEALGKSGDARAVEPLSRALSNENAYLRWLAAEALAEVGDARAVEPLLSALTDSDNGVRESAAKALGNIGIAGRLYRSGICRRMLRQT